jgi:hypothetical protein
MNLPRPDPVDVQIGTKVRIVMLAVTFKTLPESVAPEVPVISVNVVGEKYCTVIVGLFWELANPIAIFVTNVWIALSNPDVTGPVTP